MGFKGGTLAKGRFRSVVSAQGRAEVSWYTSFGHLQQINFDDTADAHSGTLDYTYQTFADGVERLVLAVYSVVQRGPADERAAGALHVLHQRRFQQFQ